MSGVGAFAVVRGALAVGLMALIAPLGLAPALAGNVSWPASSSLVVAEIVTRGAAASDQYVELYNASDTSADLADLELVYVTASGSTVTRKQAWSTGALPSGAHLLIANSSGAFAAQADGVFSGGFSTAGGSLVLRVIGGAVIDSLSWGTATSSFVEGVAGEAPPTGSSLERRPGSSAGNWLDTNDNSADTLITTTPVAQNLDAPLVPPSTAPPSATVTPSPSDAPDSTPVPTDSPPPLCATPSPSPASSQPPAPATTPPPSTAPPASTASAPPTPNGPPTPSGPPTPAPTPQPSAVPTPLTITLGAARNAPLGSTVSVVGRLTMPLGLIDDGRGAFIESGGAGIALRLLDGAWPPLAQGTDIAVTGSLADHDGQLTIEIATPADVATVGSGPTPAPYLVATGLVCEPFEGRLIAVEGLISSSPTQDLDGLRTTIDDGSGALDVVAPLGSLIDVSELSAGSRLSLVGVVGQRDLTGSGIIGYRLYLRGPDDIRPFGVMENNRAIDAPQIVTLVLVATVLALIAARVPWRAWRRRA